MSTVVLRLVKENEKLETMVVTVPRLIKKNEKLELMVDSFIKGNKLLKNRVNLLEQIVQNVVACNDEQPNVTDGVAKKDKARKQGSGIMGITDMSGEQDEEDSKESYHRDQQTRKRIVPPTSFPTSLVAFHAYLSKDSTGPLSAHHILKFDSISLNKGHGYNAYDGIFIAPTSGTYVFTWSIMSDVQGNVFSQLMKNSDIIGTRYADSATSTVWDFATGIVVVGVNQGDHVYVWLGRESVGKVLSVLYSRTTFSGWILN
ncbi:uncharacterized protein LOC125662766 isoform X2 [Ostrea edulis]|nr:uncharacterized protein LOC125662766 isoform X2 [Ostrea edulis]